jgi:DNA-binding MarR family transcriptional regulator
MHLCTKELTVDFLKERVQKINLGSPTSKTFNESQVIGCRLLYEISQNMQQQVDIDMAQYGLVGEAWIILVIVYSSAQEKIIANDICLHLGKNKSTTSRIVDSLIQKQFLTRMPDEKDRRQVFLHITEEGKQFVNQNMESHIRFHEQLWDGIDMELFLKQIIQLNMNSKQAKIK